MLTKLRTLASLYRELGPRWTIFRLAYAFRLRTGLIRLQMPQYKWTDRPLETWLKKDVLSNPKYFPSVGAGGPRPVSWNNQTAIEEADRILNGEIKYFAHEFVKTGFPPDWHKDYYSKLEPPSSAPIDSTKHWSQIFDNADVDIKFIWEPNRFAFVYTLVRAYAASHDEKYAEAFWQLTESWAESNPPNTGPNWMDGQELALRLMAWTFGKYGFAQSPASTPQRLAQLTVLIASHAERIYKNTSFAIFTHGNHSITEAMGLWMTGLLFSELKNFEKYLSFGRMSLEREARAQIFPDGTYSMYSLNYHRFILHIYLYAIRLGEINHSPFSKDLINSVTKSIEYLSQLIDPQTGQMPVYGSNDGALVLHLNNCDFTDYRPLLQLGSYITKKEFLCEPGEWDEDMFWLCGAESASPGGRGVRGEGESFTAKFAKSAKENRNLSDLSAFRGESFPNGGVYLLRNTNSKALIRCTDFTARPSHADQLHMDLWFHGQNIACDAGTYLYSGEGIWRNGLARTSTHNTVIVENKDQMKMLSRFTWTNWSKGKVLKHDENLWQGEHDGYKPVTHNRTVMSFEGDRWLVIDKLIANVSHHYALHWLLNDFLFEHNGNSILLTLESTKYKMQVGMVNGNSDLSVVRAEPNSTRGWRSRYYGHKEPAISVVLEAHQPQVAFWTFFGFESDSIELIGDALKINSQAVSI